MGAYLDKPNCEKSFSSGKSKNGFAFAACSMQGWRITQEDDHNCLPEFDIENKTALFAVYDGHGGPEVARYCSQKLPEHLLTSEVYANTDLENALVETFMSFDASLLKEDVKAELAKLTENASDDKDSDADSGADSEELNGLSEDAELSLETLVAKYGGVNALTPAARALQQKKLDSLRSPALRPKRTSAAKAAVAIANEIAAEKAAAENVDAGAGVSSKSVEDINAIADNENNENIVAASITIATSTTKEAEQTSVTENSEEKASIISENAKKKIRESDISVEDDDEDTEFNPELEEDDDDDDDGDEEEEEKDNEEEEDDEKEEDDDDEEDDDEEEDDDDDDDEEEDSSFFKSLPGFGGGNAEDKSEPGSESGTTAVVALLRRSDIPNEAALRLVVANAGDSRCVLCRANGLAEDLSVDHKPEDEQERQRIVAAGGVVTKDGRVNGGLNLSRAIGDYAYKENEDKNPREQMIIATPDVRTAELQPGDRFFILACDGIWNSLTSQQVCDFVSHQLQNKADDVDMEAHLKTICADLFDECLAEDTSGDGTGCDNMTCIIVSLDGADFLSTCDDEKVVKSGATAELKKKKRNSTGAVISNAKSNGTHCDADDSEMDGTERKRLRVDDAVAADGLVE